MAIYEGQTTIDRGRARDLVGRRIETTNHYEEPREVNLDRYALDERQRASASPLSILDESSSESRLAERRFHDGSQV